MTPNPNDATDPASAGAGGGEQPPPRATIVMTARERHGLTERAIDSILSNTARPFRLT